MKKLILLRHAKSSWSDHDLADFDRPLNKRGRLSCEFMKKRLWKHLTPKYKIESSSSARTKETFKLFFEDYRDGTPKVNFTKDLYHASAGDILDVIQKTSDKFDTLLVIGHNPGMSELSFILSGEARNMVTANFSVIEFDIDEWKLVFDDTGKLTEFDYPKKHDKFIKLLDER